MMITSVLGNIHRASTWNKLQTDFVDLEWYELNKKLLRKISQKKQDVCIKLELNHECLNEGDVLFFDENNVVVVNVIPCECIAIDMHTTQEMARICYEIGNRHAPLFFDETKAHRLLLPMDKPLLTMLQKMGCHTQITREKLIFPLGGASIHHD